MIASVVVTLDADAERLRASLDEIAAHSNLEIGACRETDRKLAVTIDAPKRADMEATTDWLRARRGVVAVDVVFVHFEEGDVAEDRSGKTPRGSDRSKEMTS